MIKLVFVGVFHVAAASNVVQFLRCHILGGSEFPLGLQELRALRKSDDETTLVYHTLASLPEVMLTFAAHSESRADRGNLLYRFNQANAPNILDELKRLNLKEVKVSVTIDKGHTYELQEYLGEGVTGYVFRAGVRDDAEGKRYAVKLSKQQSTQGNMPDNFLNQQILNEYSILRKLQNHAHVPNAYAMARMRRPMDWCTSMVSDFIGKDLSSLQGGLSLKDTLHYGIRLIRALRQLHSEFRLLHRDIKPANILIKDAGTGFAKDNELFLVDFGSATSYITLDGRHIPHELHRYVLGTHAYMSLRAMDRLTQGRQDDMFSALLSLLQVGGYYTPRDRLQRNQNAPFFDEHWRKTMKRRSVPKLFIEFWDATYNPSAIDGVGWKARPPYETLISLFEKKLSSIP
eukprot:GEMP01009006.1.p1 GENE.GEMP01009006.1~~GEMP01009006.1.p1  ORF type:complete len:403 (+),score=63.11 GEMP01009006.1:210-1418(+)